MLHTLYLLVTSHPIHRVPTLVAGFFLALMLALAACGGGDSPEPVAPTEAPAPASTAQPTSTRAAGSTASTPAPASTSVPRSTESPASTGAATPASTSAAPPATESAEPTVVSAMVLPPGLLTARPCEEVFREMLANYNGVERFDVALVTALSDQFVELRPDCLAQGWNPEFPGEPKVCEESKDLPGAITYRFNERNPTRLVAPTQWVVSESQDDEVGIFEIIEINVHLSRMPLSTDIPASMNPAGGDLIGGCWTYTGEHFENGQSRGRWSRSYFKYVVNAAGIVGRNRVFPSGGMSSVVGVTSPTSHPECDARLQDLLSAELDAGAAVDSAAVSTLVARVRAEEKEACAPLGPDLVVQPD